MHSFVRNLITEWRRLALPVSGETVVAAVSGGADSVSLLLAVHDLIERNKLTLRLVAAHFNHHLRGPESDADEQFVRDLCVKLNIELAVGGTRLSQSGNTEQNARDARYAFLTETAENTNAYAVLTGHTINDQAETFLLNLVRGSGPDGLCGMKPIRPISDAPPPQPDGCEPPDEDEDPLLFPESALLIRPLLRWAKRRETEGFCRDSGIEYRYDTMNDDTAFKRVRIRKILLPLLEDMNPNIIETLANTADLMQGVVKQQLAAMSPPDGPVIGLDQLRGLAQPALYSTLRAWLRFNRGNTRSLQLKHIQAVERLIGSDKSGKTAELPGGGRVVKSGGKLRFEENKVEN